ncbi:hypothetical protein ACJX0J_026664, partial [Zea mays]
MQPLPILLFQRLVNQHNSMMHRVLIVGNTTTCLYEHNIIRILFHHYFLLNINLATDITCYFLSPTNALNSHFYLVYLD